MKAVILAAGIGNRLRTTHNLPKCLLKINGETLLSRHISILEKYNLSELVIVTGYKQEMIKNEIDKISTELNIKLIFNKQFEKGSVLSFLAASNYLKFDSPIVLMDADVLYHPEITNRLLTSSYKNVFLLDRNFESGDEPVKLCVNRDTIIEFRKKLAADTTYDVIGESVGFFRFSENILYALHERALEYRNTSDLDKPYEEVIRDVLLKYPDSFSYEDITDIPWIEIDFPEDIEKAETVFNLISKYSNE